MSLRDNIISFWKRVKLRSSDMFTMFRVAIGVKVPTHKLHVKDSTDPMRLEGVQTDTSSSTKYLVLDSNDVIKHATAEAGSNTNTTYSISCVDGDNSDEEK